MTDSHSTFALSGVIGIVDSSKSQLELARQFGLNSVEIRADLLNSVAGMSNAEVISVVSLAKAAGLACLYTLRHRDQGGKFTGSEDERVMLCNQAFEAGADVIDLEHGTDSANSMIEQSVPLILSYHNFDSMVTTQELAELSKAMEARTPAAVKIVPTGQTLTDAATMLKWVHGAGSGVKRIGFSMGRRGSISRILALACGAPITYASFGDPVAPGQVDIKLLLERYHCMSMSVNTPVIALIGDASHIERFYAEQNGAANGQVYVAFSVAEAPTVEKLQQAMRFSELIYL